MVEVSMGKTTHIVLGSEPREVNKITQTTLIRLSKLVIDERVAAAKRSLQFDSSLSKVIADIVSRPVMIEDLNSHFAQCHALALCFEGKDATMSYAHIAATYSPMEIAVAFGKLISLAYGVDGEKKEEKHPENPMK